MICTILLPFLLSVGLAKIVPDFIHPCSDTSPECLIPASQNAIIPFTAGLPSFGIPVLDPFDVEKIEMPLSGINITFNGKLYGLSTSVIDHIKSDLEKRFFQLEFHCDLKIIGDYEAKGKLLTFPINGGGAANIKLDNVIIHLDINTDYIKDKNGVDHFTIKKYNYSIDYKGGVVYHLENLIKGNKELSDQISNFLNKEWKTVAEEMGGPVVKFAMGKAMIFVKSFFKQAPYKELLNVPIPKH